MSEQRNLAIGFIIVFIGIAGVITSYFYPFQRIDINRAHKIAEKYLASLNSPDLDIGEVMEFEQNFYIIYYEKSTSIGAFEMLIDRDSGRIFPEYGPNMMWNTKYGHGGMMGGSTWGMMGSPLQVGEMTFNEDEAVVRAQQFLDEIYPGTTADDPHPFYGYYTLHVLKDGEIFGMLSVNGYDGAVWYHNWHGAYIRSIESH